MSNVIQNLYLFNGQAANLKSDYSSTYYKIKEARETARSIEKDWKQGLMDEGMKNSSVIHWEEVKDLCISALQNETLDFDVCSWLIEALARTDGYSGLADGFNVFNNLTAKGCNNVYPITDDIEDKFVVISGLNGIDKPGALVDAIYDISITNVGGQDFSTWHYKSILRNLNSDDNNTKAEANKNNEKFNQAVNTTDSSHFRALHDDILRCKSEYGALVDNLYELYKHEAPPSSYISNAFTECLDSLKCYAKDKLIIIEEGSDDLPSKDDSGSKKVSNGRDYHLKMIDDAAAYFKSQEPHSPLSFILTKALRWSNMSLPDLLEEIIKDKSSLSNIYEITGIENTNE